MTIKEQIDKAQALLASGDLPKAELIARELVASGQLEGYGILATILAEREQLESTIQVLEQGLEAHPESWELWMRLGNYQSDMENFEQGEYALSRAEFLTNADTELIRINKAILYLRLKKYSEALEILKNTRSKYPVASLSIELNIYDDLEAYETILSKFNGANFDLEGDFDAEEAAQVYFYVAHAYWNLKKISFAKKILDISIELNRSNDDALWLKREIFGKISHQNKYYSLAVSGEWHKPGDNGEKLNFVSKYEAVAQDLGEALDVIHGFEPFEFNRTSFRIEEFEEFENFPDNPTGVYRTSMFHVFSE